MFLGGDVKPTHLEGTSNLWGLLQSDSLNLTAVATVGRGRGTRFLQGHIRMGVGRNRCMV